MIRSETTLANGWTLVTLKDGRQRAYRRNSGARLSVFDLRYADRPRVDWFVYDHTGNTVLAKGETMALDAAMDAADEATARLF